MFGSVTWLVMVLCWKTFLQAEEAKKLRKRKKAEAQRLLDMEKRQKQRLQEVRESQRKVSCGTSLQYGNGTFFLFIVTFFAIIWHYFLLLHVEWRSYTAKGAVSGCSKKGTWRYGKEIQGYDFNIACPRHLCWRWWGIPCLTDIVSP